MLTRSHRTVGAVTAVFVLCAFPPPPPAAAFAVESARPPVTALAVLGRLRVAAKSAMTGYSRAQFGAPWADTDHNRCDTRDDVLRRDLAAPTFGDRRGCVVSGGVLADPYTATAITFVRGPASTAVQIDHVVPLGLAWRQGARAWSLQRRTQFANDPLNLLAVDGPANESKSDGDAAEWLPPNAAFRCAYVARQVAVKSKYRLTVASPERTAMLAVLDSCPAQRLPRRAEVVPPPLTAPVPPPTSSPSPSPSQPPATAGAGAAFGFRSRRQSTGAPTRAVVGL